MRKIFDIAEDEPLDIAHLRSGPACTWNGIKSVLLAYVGAPHRVLHSVAITEDKCSRTLYIRALIDPRHRRETTPDVVVEQMEMLLEERAPCGIRYVCSARFAPMHEDGPYR